MIHARSGSDVWVELTCFFEQGNSMLRTKVNLFKFKEFFQLQINFWINKFITDNITKIKIKSMEKFTQLLRNNLNFGRSTFSTDYEKFTNIVFVKSKFTTKNFICAFINFTNE